MIIAIDLGDKRCGIATSFNGIAFPKDIVARTGIIGAIKKIIRENENIEAIVVGLPYDLYNHQMRQLDRSNKFIEKMKVIFPDINIVGVDERFTTFEAQAINPKATHKRDDISAALILESYLNIKK